MNPHRVLFVDDEPRVTEALKRALRREPYEILSATSAEEALRILSGQAIDVVISDECMPGMSGTEFLAQVCRRFPETIRMVLTGHANVEMAIRAINQGEIYRFFTKPCNEVDLAVTIRQALRQKELLAESRRLLRVAHRQAALLEELEKQYPGITRIQKDATGVTVVEAPAEDFETLVQQIAAEAARGEELLAEGGQADSTSTKAAAGD